MKYKPQKLWALVDRETRRMDMWGNGNEFQMPIFPTRIEAAAFKERNRYVNQGLAIVRVQVQEVKRKK